MWWIIRPADRLGKPSCSPRRRRIFGKVPPRAIRGLARQGTSGDGTRPFPLASSCATP
ncbi:MAG: hypothetical protein RMJ19_07335 [Gemmatales bacterium]|nr:hypothetical protein [Gemmatales bacterium]MDW8175468.1 hypothetical protein [Gemmatales bacterium]